MCIEHGHLPAHKIHPLTNQHKFNHAVSMYLRLSCQLRNSKNRICVYLRRLRRASGRGRSVCVFLCPGALPNAFVSSCACWPLWVSLWQFLGGVSLALRVALGIHCSTLGVHFDTHGVQLGVFWTLWGDLGASFRHPWAPFGYPWGPCWCPVTPVRKRLEKGTKKASD